MSTCRYQLDDVIKIYFTFYKKHITEHAPYVQQ